MKNDRLGIDLEGSILLIKGSQKEHLINELTIDKFSQYWRTVRQALFLYSKASDDMGFVDLWVENDLFRQLATQALELLGIENPAAGLTVSQMEAILFGIRWDGEEDITPGAGSRLHSQNFPKPLDPGATPEEPRRLKREENLQLVSEPEMTVEESATHGKPSFWSSLTSSTKSMLHASGYLSVLPIGLPLLYLGLNNLMGTGSYPMTS